jgi:hypothetical protein
MTGRVGPDLPFCHPDQNSVRRRASFCRREKGFRETSWGIQPGLLGLCFRSSLVSKHAGFLISTASLAAIAGSLLADDDSEYNERGNYLIADQFNNRHRRGSALQRCGFRQPPTERPHDARTPLAQ